MLTVSTLARACGLSRSTVLCYESIGVLKPAGRTSGNYRRYGDREMARLRQICVYRKAGVSLADVRTIFDRPNSDASSILKRRLTELDAEIEQLRDHQRAILRILNRHSFRRSDVLNKEKWVSIMKASGFTEADMHRWHKEFEKMAPEEHQEFLEFLHIPTGELAAIREWSRTGKK